MKRSRIGVSGPLAPYAAGFLAELRRVGYTPSPVKKHFYLLARVSGWLDEHGLDVVDVATARVEPFFVTRRAAGVANLRTRASLVPLVAYLGSQGVVPEAAASLPAGEAERVLAGFSTYLRCERGLVEGTARFYVHVARLLVDERVSGDTVALSTLNAHDVTVFTTRVCGGPGLSSRRQVVSALRSLKLASRSMEGSLGRARRSVASG